jgi:peptidoglycan hydrolase-like protein with peptidoglycan-binding domain
MVAAILGKIGGDAIMCCGHEEYALPQGRKTDPIFSMDDFRFKVSLIMSGGAPRASIIPARDGDNRPTLRRGDTGAAVLKVQEAIGATADGIFGARTEAAVREFQRNMV